MAFDRYLHCLAMTVDILDRRLYEGIITHALQPQRGEEGSLRLIVLGQICDIFKFVDF